MAAAKLLADWGAGVPVALLSFLANQVLGVPGRVGTCPFLIRSADH
jgi:hypothetical protein